MSSPGLSPWMLRNEGKKTREEKCSQCFTRAGRCFSQQEWAESLHHTTVLLTPDLFLFLDWFRHRRRDNADGRSGTRRCSRYRTEKKNGKVKGQRHSALFSNYFKFKFTPSKTNVSFERTYPTHQVHVYTYDKRPLNAFCIVFCIDMHVYLNACVVESKSLILYSVVQMAVQH